MYGVMERVGVFMVIAILPMGRALNINGMAVNDTLTIGFTLPWEQGWPVGGFMGSAIVVGIEEVKRRQLLPDYDIEFVVRDDYCEPRRGMQVVVDMWASVADLDVVIGSGCSVVCEPITLLASAWQIPIISWGCASQLLSDKSIAPTFSRMRGTWLGRAPVYNKLADTFGWNRIGIITTPEDLMRTTSIAAMEEMERNGKEVIFNIVDSTFKGANIDPEKTKALENVMRSMKEQARIFIMLTYPSDLRNMLITALDLGMMNGDYAFITHEYLLTLMGSEQSYRPEVDEVIWEGLLAMGLNDPPPGEEWDMFRQGVIDAFQDPRFDHLPHLPASASINEVDVYSAYVHDAVLQWAYGVNKSITQGHAPDDGIRVAQNIFNSQFVGISGVVAIDEVGDRRPNVRVVIVQEGRVKELMEWDALAQDMIKVYKPHVPGDWSGLRWYGNRTSVPGDRPLCGWHGELCATGSSDNTTTIIAASAAATVLLCVVLIAAVVRYQRHKYEDNLREIDEITFRWEELDHNVVQTKASMSSLGSMTGGKTQTDTKRGLVVSMLHDNYVVIKRLGELSINLQDRRILVALKEMREMAHDNINAFIGICPDTPNACFMMAYATRGTLEDIISDDDVTLTGDFKVSFVLDIACGMWYLHQSPVQAHGHLTSSTCVVDNRWTVKITDHGLTYIREQYKSSVATTSQLNPAKLLWTAPELIYSPGGESAHALQMGDVYSFAIIAQEVFLKDVPYAANEPELEPLEIIQQVNAGLRPPYRPIIPEGSCNAGWVELISECWDENPVRRPNYTDILTKINKIHKYKNLDLVDSMIKRLERHTKNLEERVALRSRELSAEKSKVEILLKELLPPSVAENLAVGKQVDPETFDSVTLFFSDIVGFTRISAGATPMQIVVLLNKMYTLFDDIAHAYDVYKVATIGDAYMVSSGVPIRNGTTHAGEICSLALDLLDASEGFPIDHMPEEHLRMRIGIHSGACVGGVCGIKMPRYLLFGDTVDIAARMESGGEPMKIHISDSTELLVHSSSKYAIEKRGDIFIKGKGDTATYWLTRRK